MRLVMVPGIGGSGDEHWQTRWEQRWPQFVRIEPESWDAPDLADWMNALDRAVGDGPAVIVAHSLGCLLAARWARGNPERTAGLFLVAVPDPKGPEFPSVAADFAIDVTPAPGVPAIVVASTDDPYSSTAHTDAIARAWRAPVVWVGARGHLNAASGLGEWSAGRELLTAFLAGAGALTLS